MSLKLQSLAICALLLASACSSTPPEANPQLVQLAVAETLSALPKATHPPTTVALPTGTPESLRGLFCEYQFCIGHPLDMAFYDVSAVQSQQATPSTISQGDLATYNSSLFIQVLWQAAPGVTDPQFMLDLILQSSGDARTGSVQPKLVGPLNVYYTAITPNSGAATSLPYGAAAAWTCGGRAFAWKIYAQQPEIAEKLTLDALNRFRCASQ